MYRKAVKQSMFFWDRTSRLILLTIGKNYYLMNKKGRIEISGGTSFLG
jgi:hypothetical protein